MNLKWLASSVLFCLLVLSTREALGRDYHVSVSGDDRNTGSAQQPLNTISRAAFLAQPGDLIIVHAGIYRERVTPPRGGTSNEKRIIYHAACGENVEIRGSEVIKGWERAFGSVWKVTIPSRLFSDHNPYEELIQGDWFDPMGRDHHTGEVYLNGTPLWESPGLDGIREEKTGNSYWYSESDSKGTTIWADFRDADPNAEMVEISVRRACFYPEKPGVNYITVRGFKLRHAATQWAPPTAEQFGLIGTHWSKGWIIENNVISDSRCTGITLGKYHDPDDKLEASADQYNRTIRLALKKGWSKEQIGSHSVRNNTIYRCEQAGICGSMGAIFSEISGNHIYDIWVKRQFQGAEIGGIKFHGAIDTVIRDNHIHGTGRGLWLDWMTQGTRVTGNLLYDNSTDDLFLEVNHGPFMIDNNILLSETAVRNWSEGGAFVHNLVAGDILLRPVLDRSTPFHKPHSTEVAGLSFIQGGDDRWYNNLFAGHSGLSPYDGAALPVRMEGNVFLNGASPSENESVPFVESPSNPGVELVEKTDGVYLCITLSDDWTANMPRQLVDTHLLGQARLSSQSYTEVDGTPLQIDADYFGKKRDSVSPAAGPFMVLGRGKLEWRVWPK